MYSLSKQSHIHIYIYIKLLIAIKKYLILTIFNYTLLNNYHT